MTTERNYDKLRSFLSAFPKYIEAKKDLLKLKDKSLLIQYYAYRNYFRVDKRLTPANVIRELKKFKRDNIYFKSEELGIKLYKMSYFDSADKYSSSSKLVAIFTNSLLGKNIKLNKLFSEYRTIDISYRKGVSRKIVEFEITPFTVDFMEDLPDDIYINIVHADGENGNEYSSSYNKNGFDFVYDYHNSSNDYAMKLKDNVDNQELYLFRF